MLQCRESAVGHGDCSLFYFPVLALASSLLAGAVKQFMGPMMERHLGHVALTPRGSIRDTRCNKTKNSIRGFAVNGWVFDATLGSCCSERREGAKAMSACQGVWM